MRFYQSMTRYQNGVVIYDGNPNTEKRLAVMSGKTCDNLNVGKGFIEASREWGATYSRLDLALTTDTDILTKIKESHKHVVSEKFQTGKQISDFEDIPQTLIFGDMNKRSKKGMVRCYDKALQMGLEGVTLHRIEVENRRNDAELASKRIEHGDSIASVMNSRWRIDTDWYKELMSDDIAKTRFKTDEADHLTEIQRKMAWIHKQVVPSLKYVLAYDEEHGTDNFLSIVKQLGLKFDYVDR